MKKLITIVVLSLVCCAAIATPKAEKSRQDTAKKRVQRVEKPYRASPKVDYEPGKVSWLPN